jgi:hypothetical protein
MSDADMPTHRPDDRTPRDPPSPPAPPPRAEPDSDEHEGATETDVGDLGGPGAGYDNEPEQEKDTGGVADS